MHFSCICCAVAFLSTDCNMIFRWFHHNIFLKSLTEWLCVKLIRSEHILHLYHTNMFCLVYISIEVGLERKACCMELWDEVSQGMDLLRHCY